MRLLTLLGCLLLALTRSALLVLEKTGIKKQEFELKKYIFSKKNFLKWSKSLTTQKEKTLNQATLCKSIKPHPKTVYFPFKFQSDCKIKAKKNFLKWFKRQFKCKKKFWAISERKFQTSFALKYRLKCFSSNLNENVKRHLTKTENLLWAFWRGLFLNRQSERES